MREADGKAMLGTVLGKRCSGTWELHPHVGMVRCVWGGASWNSVFWVCLGCEHEPGLQDRASKAQMCQFETCGTDSLLPTQ